MMSLWERKLWPKEIIEERLCWVCLTRVLEGSANASSVCHRARGHEEKEAFGSQYSQGSQDKPEGHDTPWRVDLCANGSRLNIPQQQVEHHRREAVSGREI